MIERTEEDIAQFKRDMIRLDNEAKQEAIDQLVRQRMSRVINRDYVRRWALDYANDNRYHKFSRVSESFLCAIEAAAKSAIRDRVHRHGSKGVTLT